MLNNSIERILGFALKKPYGDNLAYASKIKAIANTMDDDELDVASLKLNALLTEIFLRHANDSRPDVLQKLARDYLDKLASNRHRYLDVISREIAKRKSPTVDTPVDKILRTSKSDQDRMNKRNNLGRWAQIKTPRFTEETTVEELREAFARLHGELTEFHRKRLKTLVAQDADSNSLDKQRKVIDDLARNRHPYLDMISLEIRRRS